MVRRWLLALSLLAVLIAAAWLSSFPWECPPTQPPNEAAHTGAIDQDDCKSLQTLPFVVGKGIGKFFSDTVDVIERNDKVIVALSTIFIAAFTIILGFATLFLWRATRDLVGEAKETGAKQITQATALAAATQTAANAAIESNKINLANFVAMRRAWLSIEEVQFKYPTKFMENGIDFSVDVTVKNGGPTPASSVEIVLDTYYAESAVETFKDAEKRFKAECRAHPVEIGELLFPEETLTQATTWTDGLEEIEPAIKTHPSGEKKVSFTVFIGVTYRIVGDPTPHITYEPHAMNNVLIGTEIEAGLSVNLPRMPFLAGEAN